MFNSIFWYTFTNYIYYFIYGYIESYLSCFSCVEFDTLNLRSIGFSYIVYLEVDLFKFYLTIGLFSLSFYSNYVIYFIN